MGYTPEQRSIIQQIIAIGKRRGESKREIKSALLTGRIEANYSNPKVATDHDSLGWRQERQMYYKNPTDLKASINRYYNETSQKRDGRGMKSWQLAQAVQRSAFPERYQTASREAEKLLREFGGAGSPQTAQPKQDKSAPAGGASDDAKEAVASVVSKPGKVNTLELATAMLANRGSASAPETQSTPKQQPQVGRVQPVGRGRIIGTPHSGTHTLGNWQSDNALDIAMKNGSAIRAPRGAVVEKVKGSYSGGSSRFDGYQVTLRLADGNRIFLTHLSKANVRAGQRVRAGALLGRSGSANGVPHLHMGVERGNPKRYV
jgi:murein DD-endopeptidase MepM/ murein hydrolase activator NlpD